MQSSIVAHDVHLINQQTAKESKITHDKIPRITVVVAL